MMKRFVLTIVLFLVACQSEPPIRWDEANRYIGFKKTVCGLIVKVNTLDEKVWKSYYLYFGNFTGEDEKTIALRDISGRGFSLFVSGYDLGKFRVQPDYFLNKAICATGEIRSVGASPYMPVENQNLIQEK